MKSSLEMDARYPFTSTQFRGLDELFDFIELNDLELGARDRLIGRIIWLYNPGI